ncbi:MAG: chemotaxis protein CheD [Chloroflexi bacterium]|nr:chemotaxis protein CheD [Chloroflexota bacterium]MCH8868962.1 chemotaxis protein CheD [Chloroflexota bacterium]MCH9040342.1 chemotaxis protein CheD [Chloroflexota bacterium]MCI0770433.1 chemotaxis protein CheD [Chloroflexota bacterium]MCI0790557.1 chemotaxis protein CheD [Chloroflexota bacterium]
MTTTELEMIVVGLGEMQVSNNPLTVLSCLGLGSCIAVSAYDSVAKVAGLVHIVLPSSDGRDTTLPGKFADTAIPSLLDEMSKLGALKVRLLVKIAGGAQISKTQNSNPIFKTGQRNIEATKEQAAKHGLKIAAEEVGGHAGRTLRLYVESGRVTVTQVGSQTQEL